MAPIFASRRSRPSAASSLVGRARALAVGAVVVAACGGNIETATQGAPPSTAVGGSGSGAASGQPGAPGGAAGAAAPSTPGMGISQPVGDPGFSAMGLLTPREYRNTLRDLLGQGPALAAAAPGSTATYDTSTEQFSITSPQIDEYLETSVAVADAADVLKLSPCDVAAKTELGCAQRFIQTVGRRVLRRPLDAAEQTELTAAYTNARKSDDHATSLRTVLARMLMAPDFLYHVERGTGATKDGSSPLLTAHELAARLSYLLRQSMPDDTLAAAADAGALATKEQVLAQAKRLLADPRAKETVWSWAEQWLGLSALDRVQKDAATYPGFEAARADLGESLRRFTDEALWQGAGTLGAWFTAPYTFVSAKLAGVYGLRAPGTGFGRIDTDATQRAGLFTQPALLALLGKPDKSSPIMRGVFVRDRILCSPLPPPPPNASSTPPPATETKTTREYFATLTSPAACAVCHAQINPIGFAFEHFDGIGNWRDKESGNAIDDSGELTSSDVAGKLTGAVDLAEKLSRSRDVGACLSRQWFRFAAHRFEVPGDQPFIAAVAAQFQADGAKIASLPLAITQVEPFYRLHYTTKELGK